MRHQSSDISHHTSIVRRSLFSKVKFNSSGLLLIAILLLYLFTRLYQITDIPKSLYWDEASIGFNAYSIITTGKDEWGEQFPLYFKAFGEYKLPVYVYTVSFFELVLGETELAVRLPAVFYIFGSLLLIASLTKQIFAKIAGAKMSESIALLSVLGVVTSPWMLLFSRTGYEVTSGIFFYLLALYFALQADKKSVFLILTSICFGVTLYCYNSFVIITPLTVGILLTYSMIRYTRVLLRNKKTLLIPLTSAVILFCIISLPMVSFSGLGGGTVRFNQVGITQLSPSYKRLTLIFGKNYLSHFSPEFLLDKGDTNLRSHIPGAGQIYWIAVPFILIGLYSLFKKRYPYRYVMVALFLIMPIPSALTIEAPHALRSLPLSLFFSLFTALGVAETLQNIRIRFLGYVGILGLLVSFGFYFYQFLTVFPSISAMDWQYPYKQIFTQYGSNLNKYDHISITYRYTHPYIYALFYTKYDPNTFLAQAKDTQGVRSATSRIGSFGPYIFTEVYYFNFPKGNNLAFAHPSEWIREIPTGGVIKNPDGSIVLYVYNYDNK
jgi:hypothetical protein